MNLQLIYFFFQSLFLMLSSLCPNSASCFFHPSLPWCIIIHPVLRRNIAIIICSNNHECSRLPKPPDARWWDKEGWQPGVTQRGYLGVGSPSEQIIFSHLSEGPYSLHSPTQHLQNSLSKISFIMHSLLKNLSLIQSTNTCWLSPPDSPRLSIKMIFTLLQQLKTKAGAVPTGLLACQRMFFCSLSGLPPSSEAEALLARSHHKRL